MSRSGPESGGLVLRMDQKKWSVFKTDKHLGNAYSILILRYLTKKGFKIKKIYYFTYEFTIERAYVSFTELDYHELVTVCIK